MGGPEGPGEEDESETGPGDEQDESDTSSQRVKKKDKTLVISHEFDCDGLEVSDVIGSVDLKSSEQLRGFSLFFCIE